MGRKKITGRQEVLKKPTINDLYSVVEQGKDKKEKQRLTEVVDGLVASMQRYTELRERVKKFKDIKSGDSSEGARKVAHETLITNLEILVRYCKKFKIDTSWRDEIGDDRDEIGDWAVKEFFSVTRY